VLLLDGLRRVRERVRRTNHVEIEHAHPDGPHPVVTTHVHKVDVTRYTVAGAVAVGLLHGVGAETGTQALVLVSASRIASTTAAVGVLGAFVLGIVLTTSAMALTTAFGWHTLSTRGRSYKYVTLATALGSAAIGIMYLW
jgi:high-affinity nickel-transport protein